MSLSSLLASASVAVLAMWSHGAHASIHGSNLGPPPVPPCAYALSIEDGCLTASTHGSFRQGDLFVLAAQSGQTWTSHHPPQFNVPGIDYAIGYDTTLTLKDPKNDAALLPTGCTYKAVGTQNSGPEVLCDKIGTARATNPTFNGWDFSGAIGGEGCVWVHFTTNPQGTFTFTNNKFQMNGACAVNNGSLLSFAVGTVGNFVFSNNEVDGNYPAAQPASGQTGTMISHGNVGSAIITYNYFHDIPVRPLGGTNTNSAVLIAFNIVNGYGLEPGGLHGAIDEILMPKGSTTGSLQYSYNVIIAPAAAPSSGITTAFSALSAHTPTPWQPGVEMQQVKIDHNVVVSSKNAADREVMSQVLSYVQYFRKVDNYIVQDNFIDPSGALGCSNNLGGAFTMTGTVDNKAGSPGNTLTVSTLPNGGVWPGATFHVVAPGGFTDAVVQPYGTTCDGAASTGAGYTGTYCLSGAAQKITFTNGQTQNTPIDNLAYGGSGHDNINLTDGSTITLGASVQWSGGQCNGHL